MKEIHKYLKTEYILPDGTNILLNKERIISSEIFFAPFLFKKDKALSKQKGIHYSIHNQIKSIHSGIK